MSDKLGPIEIEFLLDKKADAEAKNLKNSLDAVGTTGKKANQQIKDAIKEQLKIIKEVEKELKELQKAYEKAAPGQGKKDAYQDLAQIKKVLSEEQSVLIGLQEEQIALNKKEEESANSLTGILSKWTLGLGGAAAAFGILKKAFQETTAGLNTFNIIGAITKQLLYDIVSGAGLSMQRISSAVAIQKEFNALREAGYINAFKAQQYETKYQVLYSDSLDATLSRGEKIKIIDEALEAHGKSIDIQQEHVRKSLEATRAALENQPGSEKLKKEFADLNTELLRLEEERNASTKRLTRQRSILVKEEIDEQLEWRKDLHDKLQKLVDDYLESQEEERKKEAEKLKSLNNEIEADKLKGQEKEILQLKQKYDIDLETYKDNEAIKSALAIKYAQDRYEIEMKYLDKIKEENKKITDSVSKLTLGGAYSIINRSLIKAGKKPAQWGGPNKLMPTNQSEEGIDKQKKKNLDAENDALEKQIKKRNEIVQAAASLVYQIGEAVGLSEEQQKQLGATLDVFTQMASGDYIGAAMSMISVLLSAIPNEAARFAAQIEHINQLIKEQQRLIELSERKGGKEEALREDLELKEKADQLNKLELAKLEHKQKHTWKTSRKKDIEDLKLAIIDSEDAAEDAQQALDDYLGGGVTENTIADAITGGFKEGKKSVDDFAGYMSDVLFNAALSVFKNEILGEALTEYQEMITEAFSDKVFTEEEKEAILARGQELTDDWKKVWEDMMGVFAPDQGDINSLSGAIRGVTEETASILAGQINAIRIAQSQSNNMMQSSFIQLAIIASNTGYLKSIDSKLDALENNPLRAQGIL